MSARKMTDSIHVVDDAAGLGRANADWLTTPGRVNQALRSLFVSCFVQACGRCGLLKDASRMHHV